MNKPAASLYLIHTTALARCVGVKRHLRGRNHFNGLVLNGKPLKRLTGDGSDDPDHT